jgi:hypothetical protein
VPVYLLYWTAIAADNGTVEFRRDLYDRDERLIAALAAPPAEDTGDVNARFGQNGMALRANLDDARGQADRVTWTEDRSSGIDDPLPVQDRQAETDQLADSPPEPTRFERATLDEPARAVERPWRNDSASTNNSARAAQPEPVFPRIKRFFDGSRSQRRDIHR